MWTLAPWLLAVLVVGGTYAYERATISGLRDRVAALTLEIDDPATGWRRQLSVCHENDVKIAEVSAAVVATNGKIEDLGKAQADIAARQDQIRRDAAQGAKTVAETVRAMVTAKPISGDSCADALAIQRRPLP